MRSGTTLEGAVVDRRRHAIDVIDLFQDRRP
jgi:hypothetical protein